MTEKVLSRNELIALANEAQVALLEVLLEDSQARDRRRFFGFFRKSSAETQRYRTQLCYLWTQEPFVSRAIKSVRQGMIKNLFRKFPLYQLLKEKKPTSHRETTKDSG